MIRLTDKRKLREYRHHKPTGTGPVTPLAFGCVDSPERARKRLSSMCMDPRVYHYIPEMLVPTTYFVRYARRTLPSLDMPPPPVELLFTSFMTPPPPSTPGSPLLSHINILALSGRMGCIYTTSKTSLAVSTRSVLTSSEEANRKKCISREYEQARLLKRLNMV